jgi:hypothetical protein
MFFIVIDMITNFMIEIYFPEEGVYEKENLIENPVASQNIDIKFNTLIEVLDRYIHDNGHELDEDSYTLVIDKETPAFREINTYSILYTHFVNIALDNKNAPGYVLKDYMLRANKVLKQLADTFIVHKDIYDQKHFSDSAFIGV